MIPCYAASTSV